jgi:hypothetical protein
MTQIKKDELDIKNDFYVDSGIEDEPPQDLHHEDLLEAALQKSKEKKAKVAKVAKVEEGVAPVKQPLFSKVPSKFQDRKFWYFLAGVSGLIIVGVIFSNIDSYVKNQRVYESAQVAEMNLLQSNIGQDVNAIENNQNINATTQGTILKQLGGINNAVGVLKSDESGDHRIFKALLAGLGLQQEEDKTIESQISDLQSQVIAIKAKPSVIQNNQVDANNLPFTVLSIEPWNNAWAVSIESNLGTQLYMLNQSTMGWTVQSINPDLPSVTFVNDQNQTATVSLAYGNAS